MKINTRFKIKKSLHFRDKLYASILIFYVRSDFTMIQPNPWQPSAPLSHLIKRARILQKIRQFFYDRNITEVETPILSQAAVTDVHLDSFHTQYNAFPNVSQCKTLSLITSPEYHMKRLITAGIGPIYQITKCFRNEATGRYHNPEFTLLEWYRPGFEMTDMIDEVDALLKTILQCKSAERISYQDLFYQHLGYNPLTVSEKALYQKVESLHLGFECTTSDRDNLLQFLFTFGVEPHIGQDRPIAVYGFPATQAALAEIYHDDPRIAKRFEFYYKGVELANGFKELTCAKEQRSRFENDNQLRAVRGLPQQHLDEYFLSALDAGMPETSGVAVGVDRLIMLAMRANQLSDVLSFNVERA